MKFPKPVFAPDDGESGGGNNGEQRPEYMPEKFWDAETGVANVEALATSYSESETRLNEITRGGKTAEDWDAETRATITEELKAEGLANRPEDAGKYEYKIPEGLELPEGVEWQMNENDPLLGWWRETAFSNGMSQDQFNSGVADYIKMQVGSLPDYNTEMKLLGENAKQRIDNTNMWAKANLSEKAFNALEGFMVEAKGVELMEEIMSLGKQTRVNSAGDPAGDTKILTKVQIKELQKDKRYWDNNHRDPEYVSMVDAAWKAAFPGTTKTAPLNPTG